MPYRVHVENPVSVSWASFIREPYALKKRFVLASLAELRARRIHPTSEKRAFGEFFIHRGRYHIDPDIHQRKVARYGLPVAATLDGELIGGIDTHNIWVHPAFQKKGLAVEMLEDRFRYTGGDPAYGWHNPLEPGQTMLYTHEGFAVLKATYRKLVEQRFIDPGPDGVPV